MHSKYFVAIRLYCSFRVTSVLSYIFNWQLIQINKLKYLYIKLDCFYW